ncbi:MAG: DHH family phosphoesterase [Pseudomonadota bacterium]
MQTIPTQAAIDELARLAGSARRVLITGPKDVDGDSIGSALALARVLGARTGAGIVVAGECGWRYAELPGAATCVANEAVEGPFDLAIVLDGDRRRLDELLVPFFDAATHTVVIDHHPSTTGQGHSLALLDYGAAATAEIVWRVLEAWGTALDAPLAQLLYTGIIYDTGGLKHSNTTAATLRFAARLLDAGAEHNRVVVRTTCERRPGGLRAFGQVLANVRMVHGDRISVGVVRRALFEHEVPGPGDLDFLVDQILYVVGVEIAILAVERPGAGGQEVKLSLRSRGRVDVGALAHRLHETGGGHMRAAGVVLHGEIDRLLDEVVLPQVVAALEAPAPNTP